MVDQNRVRRKTMKPIVRWWSEISTVSMTMSTNGRIRSPRGRKRSPPICVMFGCHLDKGSLFGTVVAVKYTKFDAVLREQPRIVLRETVSTIETQSRQVIGRSVKRLPRLMFFFHYSHFSHVPARRMLNAEEEFNHRIIFSSFEGLIPPRLMLSFFTILIFLMCLHDAC